jgi:cytochrome P450
VFCAADDVAVISAFLEGRRIAHQVHRGDYAYHTPRFANCKEQILMDLAHLRPKPQNFPYYSSLAGGLLPATAFTDARYWYWMLAQPVWFNTAFEAALSDGYGVVLNIGPHPSLDPYLRAAAAKLGKTPLFLNSLQDDESEEITFGRSLDRLRTLGLVRPVASGRGLDHHVAPDTVDFGSEGAIRDPYPLLEGLRAQGPVHFLPRHGYWLALGHQEVSAALRRPDLFTSAPGAGLDPVLLAAPPEHHARARRIVANNLRPEQEVGPEAIAIADHLLDRPDISGRLDLVGDFAVPLSEKVAARFFGLTEADFAAISQIVGADRYGLAYVPALQAWFARYAEDGRPDTLLARMTGGAGDRFTAAEAASILTLMWVAGTTTSGMLIASAAKILLYQPDVRAEVIEHPGLISDLIEETLRIEPPEQTVWRRTSAEASLGGVTIPAGAEVRLSLAAANRDPRHFADAASFMLQRKPAHLAFGGGLHHCIGAGLARLTARIALERLLLHVPHMRPELPINRLRYAASDHFRALAALGILTAGHSS